MKWPKGMVVRGGMASFACLLLATLSGCVAYTGYPPGDYSYSYPSGYYGDYYRSYAYSYNYRPYYSPDYNSYYNTYGTSGGGDR
jgi:hypothetical protein